MKECKNIMNAEEVYQKIRETGSFKDEVRIILEAIMKGKVPCDCGCNPKKSS